MILAIILAGGKGTRLASRLNGLPKPLVPVGDVPLLERQLDLLRRHGINDVMLLVNHKREEIENFCRGNGNFGMNLTLVDDGEPRGTAGAVLAALQGMADDIDELLIIYGDTLLNVNLEAFMTAHRMSGADVTLFLHPNSHPHDSDLVEIDGNGRITAFHPYPHPENEDLANLATAALYAARKNALAHYAHGEGDKPLDFVRELFPRMHREGKNLHGYVSPEYIKDMGTPERLDAGCADVASGRFANGSLTTARAAVFLDRDGVINRERGLVRRKDEVELLPGAAHAIRRLNREGYLCVVITNQPVIARGECSEAGLAKIHARLDKLLGSEGAYLDRIYYCPHHPDKGFPGEVPELKISCGCRKPEIGLICKAAADLNIDLKNSWMIGDMTSDILAGKRAGLKTILVETGFAGKDGKYEQTPDFVAPNLAEAVNLILQK